MWHARGRGEVLTVFWWVSVRVRDHLKDPNADGRLLLERIVKKSVGKAWIGFMWLRTGTSGELLYSR
jgi:hypothetical protein